MSPIKISKIIFLRFYLFLEIGEAGLKERERNIDVREEHQSVASRTSPDRGPNLKPSHVP